MIPGSRLSDRSGCGVWTPEGICESDPIWSCILSVGLFSCLALLLEMSVNLIGKVTSLWSSKKRRRTSLVKLAEWRVLWRKSAIYEPRPSRLSAWHCITYFTPQGKGIPVFGAQAEFFFDTLELWAALTCDNCFLTRRISWNTRSVMEVQMTESRRA